MKKPSREKIMTDNTKHQLLSDTIDKFGVYLINYVTRKCGDYELAKEVTQKLWMHVYEKFPPEKYEEINLLKWKASNLMKDELRKRKTRSFVSYVPDPPEHFDSSNSEKDEETTFQEFWSLFCPPVEISDRDKKIFWLNIHIGYTMQEIAQALKIGKTTVYTSITRTKKKCLAHLNHV